MTEVYTRCLSEVMQTRSLKQCSNVESTAVTGVEVMTDGKRAHFLECCKYVISLMDVDNTGV